MVDNTNYAGYSSKILKYSCADLRALKSLFCKAEATSKSQDWIIAFKAIFFVKKIILKY